MPLLFVALGAAAQVPAPAGAPLRVIELTGRITQSAVPELRAVFEGIDTARFPAGALVLLDSQGGDGLAAIEIGRMVRAAQAHVFVRGRCASACVFVLAGGVVRGVLRDGAIGIHRPRLTTFVKGLGVVDINAATNPNAAAALEAGNRQSQAYFSEMGLPDAFFAAMMAAPSDQTCTSTSPNCLRSGWPGSTRLTWPHVRTQPLRSTACPKASTRSARWPCRGSAWPKNPRHRRSCAATGGCCEPGSDPRLLRGLIPRVHTAGRTPDQKEP